MCLSVLLACMYMHHVHALLIEARRGHRLPGTGVIHCVGTGNGNIGSLEERPELLATNPSLQQLGKLTLTSLL